MALSHHYRRQCVPQHVLISEALETLEVTRIRDVLRSDPNMVYVGMGKDTARKVRETLVGTSFRAFADLFCDPVFYRVRFDSKQIRAAHRQG